VQVQVQLSPQQTQQYKEKDKRQDPAFLYRFDNKLNQIEKSSPGTIYDTGARVNTPFFYAMCSIYSMKCYKRYGGPLILNSILDADRSSLTLYAMGESGSGAGYE